jgi:phage shock protein A
MSEKDEDKLATLKRDLASLQAKIDEYEKQKKMGSQDIPVRKPSYLKRLCDMLRF